MLGLRAGGINLNKFSSIFDFDFREKYYSSVEALILRNYGIMNEEKFRLTEKGYIIADEIVSRYF